MFTIWKRKITYQTPAEVVEQLIKNKLLDLKAISTSNNQLSFFERMMLALYLEGHLFSRHPADIIKDIEANGLVVESATDFDYDRLWAISPELDLCEFRLYLAYTALPEATNPVCIKYVELDEKLKNGSLILPGSGIPGDGWRYQMSWGGANRSASLRLY